MCGPYTNVCDHIEITKWGVMYVLVHIGRIKNLVAITVKVAEMSRYVHISYWSVCFVLRVSECG
jgi:hypothetical protein